MNKQIGYYGLGKMGLNMALRLKEKGWEVIASNRSQEPRDQAKEQGLEIVETLADIPAKLSVPRLIWLMVSHKAVDEVLDELLPHLEKGDVIIDGGNSFFKDSIRRAAEVEEKGFKWLDIGTSGGPGGARDGACLMIGGNKEVYETYTELFSDIAAPNAFAYFGKAGAGHFVKMVHNGIEYGMMQAIGEGFELMKKSDFNLDLAKVAKLYNHRSVIESRLVGWLENAYKEEGVDLSGISGEVSHSGEGLWTVETAKEMGISVEVIAKSLEFRVKSQGNPSYTGQVVSALRNQFGGHEVGKN